MKKIIALLIVVLGAAIIPVLAQEGDEKLEVPAVNMSEQISIQDLAILLDHKPEQITNEEAMRLITGKSQEIRTDTKPILIKNKALELNSFGFYIEQYDVQDIITFKNLKYETQTVIYYDGETVNGPLIVTCVVLSFMFFLIGRVTNK